MPIIDLSMFICYTYVYIILLSRVLYLNFIHLRGLLMSQNNDVRVSLKNLVFSDITQVFSTF